MKTTLYFKEQVLRKRPYLKEEWLVAALSSPDKKEVQNDGRIRYYKHIPELGRFLRLVTLDDGQTIHNAFPDRDFEL